MDLHLPLLPNPNAPRLTRNVTGRDHTGADVAISVVEERPLTIFLNSQEIVTAMTIGDYPEYLALGFLRNQRMLRAEDTIIGVDYDDDIDTVVVRTATQTNYEEKTAQENPHLWLCRRHRLWRYDGWAGRCRATRHQAAHK